MVVVTIATLVVGIGGFIIVIVMMVAALVVWLGFVRITRTHANASNGDEQNHDADGVKHIAMGRREIFFVKGIHGIDVLCAARLPSFLCRIVNICDQCMRCFPAALQINRL